MTLEQDTSTTGSTDSEASVWHDPEWRAVGWGLGGALAFLGGGVVLGFVQGGLLPWECQGLACLFTQVILMYTGIVVAVWLVAGIALALARRRWPRSQWRLWGPAPPGALELGAAGRPGSGGARHLGRRVRPALCETVPSWRKTRG